MEPYRPKVKNPYPDQWSRIDDFCFSTRLVLGREPKALRWRGMRESSYVVLEPYTVKFRIDGMPWKVTVPEGMLTDLASVPRFARSVVGRVGPHLEAAIVHDYLYIAWQLLDRHPRLNDWRFANAVMFAGMKAARVPWLQRMAVEVALRPRLVSWRVYRSRDDRPDGSGLFVR